MEELKLQDWAHQNIAFERFKDKEFFGLLFDCGTGKTRTFIRIAEDKELPVLVIAPKNILEQWEEAIEEHGEKDSDVFIFENSKKKTKKFKKAFQEFLDRGTV